MLPMKHILAPVDFSEASYVALEHAVELSNHFHAELCVLHVVAPVPTPLLASDYSFHVPKYEETLQDDAQERLRELISGRIEKKVPARPLVAYGLAAEEIVRVATEEKVDLIVIATHRPPRVAGTRFWKFSDGPPQLGFCPGDLTGFVNRERNRA